MLMEEALFDLSYDKQITCYIVIMQDHWKPLLIQFLMEASLGSCFYTWFR
jgi:hypothetical protein